MDLLQQFYDKRLWYVWGALLAAHLLAFAVQHTVWAVIPLVATFVASIVLTLKKIEWGLAFAFLEIFIGGHGHLFDLSVMGFSISIRIVIFLGVMLAWLCLLLRRKVTLQFVSRRDTPWILLGLAILLGGAIGFATNDHASAFDDFNSYLSALYVLPMISVTWKAETRRLLLLTLSAGAFWMAGSSLVLLFAFTHLPGMFLKTLYVFLRDARLAEITLLTVPSSVSAMFPNGAWYFRIFEQSQFLIVAFELVFLTATFMLYRTKEDRLPMGIWALHAFCIASIIASFSRSFFLGIIAAGIFLCVTMFIDQVSLQPFLKKFVFTFLSGLIAIIALFTIVVFPLPIRPDFSDSPFSTNTSDSRTTAVTSRWNLLEPMMDKIRSSPIFGLGFGETVTYTSNDPRIRAENPTGEYTTYRFEWGYQDLWLKTGIFGLVAVFWYLFGIINATVLRIKINDEQRWLSVGFASAIIALFVIHALSPYLNHPIGIGFMIFVLPFFPWRDEKYEREELHVLSRAKDALETLHKPQIGIVTRVK